MLISKIVLHHGEIRVLTILSSLRCGSVPCLATTTTTPKQQQQQQQVAYYTTTKPTGSKDNILATPDIVDKIASDHNLSKAESKRIVNKIFDTIAEGVAGKQTVKIANFGSFQTVHTNARKGRNPATGEDILIPAKERIKFKPYSSFKSIVNPINDDES